MKTFLCPLHRLFSFRSGQRLLQCVRILTLLGTFAAGSFHSDPILAATSDCIGDSADGTRICVRATLSPYAYGFCIANSLSTTQAAADYCGGIHPQPWYSDSDVTQFVECLPVRQYGACAAQANLTGWAGPGASDGSLVPQCSVQTVQTDVDGNELFSYSRLSPTFQTIDPNNGSCSGQNNYYAMFARRVRQYICPQEFTQLTKADGRTWCSKAPAPACSVSSEQESKCGKVNSAGGATFGDPIQVTDQTKSQSESDYRGVALNLIRVYRKNDAFVPSNGQTYLAKGFGPRWTHNYERHIYPFTGNAFLMAAALRPDGSIRYFKPNGREHPNLGPSALLTPQMSGATVTGWRLVSVNNEIEDYDAGGQLLSINYRGAVVTMTYSTAGTPPSIAPGPGYLIQVTDFAGRALNFDYTATGRITRRTDPAGAQYLNAYDEATAIRKPGEVPSIELTSVTYPMTGATTSKRLYYYNEPTYFNPAPMVSGTSVYARAMTGIGDENGSRFAYFYYTNVAPHYAFVSTLAGG